MNLNLAPCSAALSLAASRKLPSTPNATSGPRVQRTPLRQVRSPASDSERPANGVITPRPPKAPKPQPASLSSLPAGSKFSLPASPRASLSPHNRSAPPDSAPQAGDRLSERPRPEAPGSIFTEPEAPHSV